MASIIFSLRLLWQNPTLRCPLHVVRISFPQLSDSSQFITQNTCLWVELTKPHRTDGAGRERKPSLCATVKGLISWLVLHNIIYDNNCILAAVTCCYFGVCILLCVWDQGEGIFRLRNVNIVGFYYLFKCATCFGHTTIFNYIYIPRTYSIDNGSVILYCSILLH
jgi:hypothetical protein